MGERLYLVYDPFPNGEGGVPLGLFASASLATDFMTMYFDKYYNERVLAIMVVPVNGSNNLHSYLDPKKEVSDNE